MQQVSERCVTGSLGQPRRFVDAATKRRRRYSVCRSRLSRAFQFRATASAPSIRKWTAMCTTSYYLGVFAEPRTMAPREKTCCNRSGLSKRFGVIYADFANQKRTPRLSFEPLGIRTRRRLYVKVKCFTSPGWSESLLLETTVSQVAPGIHRRKELLRRFL